MNEFKVNEYITLKLESNETNIYVNGIKFIQCKRLVLNIPTKDIRLYDNIDSIDEASEYYDHYLYKHEIHEERNGQMEISHYDYEIPYEAEFWGHCSNLQVWYDHDYDTRLLHSNLAFPLLKKLTESGDLVAKNVFKEEIINRIKSGYLPVFIFLIEENYLTYFDQEELLQIRDEIEELDLKHYENKQAVNRIKSYLRRNIEVLSKELDYIEDRYDFLGYEEELDEIQHLYLNKVLKIIFEYLDDSEILQFLLKITKTRVFGLYYPPYGVSLHSDWARIDSDEANSDDIDEFFFYEDKVFPYYLNDINQIRDLILRCFKSEDTELRELSRNVLDEYDCILFEPIINSLRDDEKKEEAFKILSILMQTSTFFVKEIIFELLSGKISWIFGYNKEEAKLIHFYTTEDANAMNRLNDYLPEKSEVEKVIRFKNSILKLFQKEPIPVIDLIFYLDFVPYLEKKDLNTLIHDNNFVERLSLIVEIGPLLRGVGRRGEKIIKWRLINNYLTFLNKLFSEVGNAIIKQIQKFIPPATVLNMVKSLIRALNELYNNTNKEKNLDLINSAFKSIESMAKSINKSVSYEEVTKPYP